jgi:hypothetical protein
MGTTPTASVKPLDLGLQPRPFSELGAPAMPLRRFGRAEQVLDIDFGRVQPALITDIIVACSDSGRVPIDRAEIDGMSVSARIACLLLVVQLEGIESLDVRLSCPALECGDAFELDLSVAEVLAFASATEDAIVLEIGGVDLQVRRATGADQLAWQQAGFATSEMARAAILRSLLLSEPGGGLDESQLDAVEAALDEHDTLVCFTVDIVCPACGSPATHEVALADLALDALRGVQARLIESVHLLASKYGWSEREVLSLPPWRRERYTALVYRGTT